MSHFTVLVTGEDFNKALEPFIEQQEAGYEQYFTFTPRYTPEEMQAEFEKYKAEGSKYGEYESVEEYAEEYHGYGEDDRDEAGNYGSVRNPNAKWDWYELGGRWSGMLHLKEGATGYKGAQYFRGTEYPEVTGKVDSALKRDIDIHSMRETEAADARKYVTAPLQAIVGLPMYRTWESVREAHTNNIDKARDVYHAQLAVNASREAAKNINDNNWFSLGDVLDKSKVLKTFADQDVFTQDMVDSLIEAYVENRRNTALNTFALLHDGKWAERGEMGWFATVSNENDDWDDQFMAIFNSLPDDTRINIVDCHI